jgi:broad specificity phosphatase PhoE
MTRLLTCLLALAVAWPGLAYADDTLLRLMREGGQVLFIRHASTDPGVGDPAEFRLEDCATQRNLSAKGREEARRLGQFLQTQKVPVARVVSSPWCRCLDTARLAFERVDERWGALSNLFGRGHQADRQLRELRPRIGEWKGQGNLVLVSHGSVASVLAGLHPAQGEIIVLSPLGGDAFRVAGRLSAPR